MAIRGTVLEVILYVIALVIVASSAYRRFLIFTNLPVPGIDRSHIVEGFNDPSSEFESTRPSTSPPQEDSEENSVDDQDCEAEPMNGQRELLEIRYQGREEMRSGQNHKDSSSENEVQIHQTAQANRSSPDAVIPDAKIRQLKDLLIQARIYVDLPNAPFAKELHSMIKELHRAVGERTKDSELPKDIDKKLRAMEETLMKGMQIEYDCSAVVRKLLAMIHSANKEIRALRQMTTYLIQVTAKTMPRGLHCLPLRLTAEYFSKSFGEQQQQPSNVYPERTDDPNLYHYALFSDNILATAVVVNSTVSNAKIPEQHVFHIVTDKWHYAAMKMWFIANPPGKAHVHVQNIEDFTWLNSSYSPVLKQLRSKSMIKYYFKSHGSKSKYRNPKYLSILNHLRFYLPEVLPKLDKVVFLDDDVVVQKDLTDLWNIDMKGKVNGAVETCGTEFHRFRRYLNFSNPLIAENFDPHACGWAFGMNVFDLAEWRKQNITQVYHYWQNKNAERQLWLLGSLPPGLLTFYNQTFPLDRSWHVLGLGYNPYLDRETIERAAVIHYNGNFKPWLEVAFPAYRGYWSKFVNYDHIFLQDCKITP